MKKGVVKYLEEIEAADMSDAFWEFSLPQRLDSPNSSAPALSAFFASQIVNGSKGLFSATSQVRDLYGASDVHHIFPKAYLRRVEKLDNRSIYNQVANYTYLDTPINIAVGDKAPNDYFSEAIKSAQETGTVFGYPMTLEDLKKNMEENCIPFEIKDWTFEDYLEKFLPQRRKLMAKKIEEYYKKL